MNIFYAFNDAYAPLAGISIYSLLVNNQQSDCIRFFIVDSGISEENRKKITDIINEFNRDVYFLVMPNINEIIGNDTDIGRWNINVYSKLFVGSLLPKDVHKVLCIDCDTVIVRALDELWNTNLSESIVAGVNEAMSKYYRRYLGKNDKDSYLNSGMLLFNLDLIRSEKYEQNFLSFIKKYKGNLPYLDQDTVNAVVPENKIIVLHPKYNAVTPIFCCSYKELIKTRMASVYYSETEFNEAKNDPFIIHFTTFFMSELRPWFDGSNHPKLNEFLKYKNSSPWKTNSFQKKSRKIKDELKNIIVKSMPRIMLCELSSFLHGMLVPIMNGNKLNKIIR